MSAKPYDLLIKNARVVRPHGNAVHESDIAIAGGKFAKVAPGIDVALAKTVQVMYDYAAARTIVVPEVAFSVAPPETASRM